LCIISRDVMFTLLGVLESYNLEPSRLLNKYLSLVKLYLILILIGIYINLVANILENSFNKVLIKIIS
jgi:hypothetical protein